MTSTIPYLCGSVAGKASPLGVKMHDSGYAALDLTFKYIAIGTDNLPSTIQSVKSLGFRGFGVSMPFKQEIIQYLDEVTPEVKAIGACNTVVVDEGRLIGYNTDWQGAIAALKECSDDLGAKATIIGAGGVARAIAYGLKQNGIKVYVAARSSALRSALVDELQLDGHCSIEDQGQFGSSLIVNATPLADYPGGPVNLDMHLNSKLLLDVVFQCKDTPITIEAASRSMAVAKGWRMLLHQALRQFELYTGQKAPLEAMGKVLSDALS
jgi:shikimate dehydrogenase